ncbi:LCP family glycopolymer transferase [Enterocloster hominis (ex Hitch et al. 2024)]|uniref:LCP family protein n=1 Tax=Enterocloster hominis (ex Hitch et al. 2024) TaxID=1917870 RepID=A0ABV1DAG0_9FIRM
MNRDLENGFGQEDERLRSRSRQRRDSAGVGADSDTTFPRRSRTGAEGGSTGRPAGAAGRPGPAVRGRDEREGYTGQETGGRAAGENQMAGSRTAGDSRMAGSRAAVGNRGSGNRTAGEDRMAGSRAAGDSRMAGSRTVGENQVAGSRAAGGSRMAGSRAVGENQVAGSRAAVGNRMAGNRIAGDDRMAGNRTAGESRMAGSRTAGENQVAGSRTAGEDRIAGTRTAGQMAGSPVPGRRVAGDSGAAGGRASIDGSVPGGRGPADGRVTGNRGTADGRVSGSRAAAGSRAAGNRAAADNTVAVSRGTTDNRGTADYRAAGTRQSRIYTPETDLGEDRGRGGRENAFRRNDKDGPDGPGRKSAREAAAADSSGNGGRRKARTIAALIVAEVFALLVIFGARYVLQQANRIQRDPNFKIEDETNPYLAVDKVENMEGYWTVALFGVDSRDNSLGKGNNTDVIIIANVNQKNGEIKLVSIFRDTYLNLDDDGTYNKINQAYARGGPKQAIKALNKNLDIQIDDYATFNWKAVADSINILGGVDIELSKAEFYYINAYITETVEATGVASQHLKSAGMNHLDGVQAVAYARLRKMDTDFARTERQREIIQQCFGKLRQANFSVINNVMEVVFEQILSSVTLNDIIPAAKNLTKYTIVDTMGFPKARSDANMGKKGDCVIPQTLESNVIELHKFLFDEEDYQPSDMVKKISAKISADSGLYKEGKPIESVGTDGGYIPKPTEPSKSTEESTTKNGTDESESSTSETDEGVLDYENEWDLETDEFGNVIDPPEDYYPGGTRPSSGNRPGGGTSGTIPYPGYTTAPADESNGNLTYPGSPTSPGDSSTGPGAVTQPYPGSTNGTTAAYPGSTKATTAAYPGSTKATTAPYPGGNNGTTAPSPGSTNGTTAPSPGSNSDEYVPGGPGSIIIGPGL